MIACKHGFGESCQKIAIAGIFRSKQGGMPMAARSTSISLGDHFAGFAGHRAAGGACWLRGNAAFLAFELPPDHRELAVGQRIVLRAGACTAVHRARACDSRSAELDGTTIVRWVQHPGSDGTKNGSIRFDESSTFPGEPARQSEGSGSGLSHREHKGAGSASAVEQPAASRRRCGG